MTSDEQCNPPRKLEYARGKIGQLASFFPGQLITADDMNALVEALKELDQRVAEFEARCK